MRWPLKHQILLRMLLLLTITIAAITVAQIRRAIVVTESRESLRMQRIGRLLSESRFPLTSTVLQQMNSLSGAEFVVAETTGALVAKTDRAPWPIPENQSVPEDRPEKLDTAQGAYFHSRQPIPHPSSQISAPAQLHLFLPRKTDAVVWWESSQSPLWIAVIVFPIAVLLSLAMAGQVTRPLARVQHQAQQIAAGEMVQIDPPNRRDEIRDLHLAMNHMAAQLAEYRGQVRDRERLQALVDFGDSVAHHLRNSTTGCRMAIELLAMEQPEMADRENYQVALRQLDLMNSYLKKFLRHSRTDGCAVATEPVDLVEVLQTAVYLLRPNAEHREVQLRESIEVATLPVVMDPGDAEQVMINLVGNAIEAASENATRVGTGSVEVILDRTGDGTARLTVIDDGSGPPADIAEQLFEPFVTGKSEGTGLGLSLVRDVAHRMGGEVRWSRVDHRTHFVLEFTPPTVQPQPGSNA